MNRNVAIVAALLFAVPLLAQNNSANPQVKNGEVVWFSINDSKQQILKSLGQPAITASFGLDFESWQYRLGSTDHDDFSHLVVFRKSDQTLVSVTRNFDPERTVDDIFPAAKSIVYFYPNAQKPEYAVRVRKLPGGAVLMAMGISKQGQLTGQVVLMRAAELKHFYPWLFDQLKDTK